MAESFREQLQRWVRKLRVRRCPFPFVIVFRERSGSTYLCSLLDLHQQISCRREDFHEVFVGSDDHNNARRDLSNWERRIQNFDGSFSQPATRTEAIQHLYDVFSFPTPACGFKLKFPKQFSLYADVVNEFRQINELRMIVLSRRNVIKQAVSRQNFMRIHSLTGKANLTEATVGKSSSMAQFLLDVDLAIQYAQHAVKEQAAFLAAVDQIKSDCGLEIFELEYENLLKNRDDTMRQVFDFLRVESDLPIIDSDLKKATPNKLANAIVNYEELVEAVRDTDFQSMLDD